MELRRYLSLLRKWGWLMLLLVGLAAAGSYFYSQQIKPTYRTTAILLVGQEQASANPTVSDIYVSNNLAQAYALLVNQPSVLQAAAKELNWDGSWESLYFVVSATAPQGGQTINVTATANSPERAQQIANVIANQVIAQSPLSRQQQAADTQREFMTSQQALLQAQIVAAQKQLADLNQQAAIETDQTKIDAINVRIAALQTKIDNAQRTYIQMGALLSQASGKYITLISPASLPTAPISPNIPQNILLAAIAGLVLSIGVVLLLEYLDDTIKNSEDVSSVMKLSTLGSIARISPIRNADDALIAFKHPRSPIAEEYRSLRTNLRYAGIENPGGALLVTSANPGEGKTTTAANLAIAIAQSGKRVVLVDADMRRPGMAQIFGLKNEIGLTSLFLDEPLTLNDVLQATEVPGLRILASGEQPPNPAEMLESRRMTEILQLLRHESDMVIVDSPPALVVADASILASRCSGAILVIDGGRTRTEAARRLSEILSHSQVKVFGVVLNRLGGRSRGYSNYYYYQPSTKGTKTKIPRGGHTQANGNGNGSGHANGKTPAPSRKENSN